MKLFNIIVVSFMFAAKESTASSMEDGTFVRGDQAELISGVHRCGFEGLTKCAQKACDEDCGQGNACEARCLGTRRGAFCTVNAVPPSGVYAGPMDDGTLVGETRGNHGTREEVIVPCTNNEEEDFNEEYATHAADAEKQKSIVGFLRGIAT